MVRQDDRVVLDREVDILGRAAGEQHLQANRVIVREDVDGRETPGGTALEVLPHVVELVGVNVEQVVEQSPRSHVENRVHSCFSFPPRSGHWLLTFPLLHCPCQPLGAILGDNHGTICPKSRFISIQRRTKRAITVQSVPVRKGPKLEIRNSVGGRMPMVCTCNSTVRDFNVFIVSGSGKLIKITHGGIGTRRFAQVLVRDLF